MSKLKIKGKTPNINIKFQSYLKRDLSFQNKKVICKNILKQLAQIFEGRSFSSLSPQTKA
jgi:hypothetical protein